MAISRWAAVLTVVVALALTGCGSDDDDGSSPFGGPGPTEGGSSEAADPFGSEGLAPGGPAEPAEVFTELAHRLADGDSARACALFTEAGQASFAMVYESSSCVGAADVAAAEIEDKEAVRGWTFEGRGLKVSGDTAKLSESCRDSQPGEVGWGSVTLKKTDAGWLITSMEPLPTFASCGG